MNRSLRAFALIVIIALTSGCGPTESEQLLNAARRERDVLMDEADKLVKVQNRARLMTIKKPSLKLKQRLKKYSKRLKGYRLLLTKNYPKYSDTSESKYLAAVKELEELDEKAEQARASINDAIEKKDLNALEQAEAASEKIDADIKRVSAIKWRNAPSNSK